MAWRAPSRAGPVFSVDAHDGACTCATRRAPAACVWKDDRANPGRCGVPARVACSRRRAHVFRLRLEPGMGLVCNNVLHDRSGFVDDPRSSPAAVPGPLSGSHRAARIAGRPLASRASAGSSAGLSQYQGRNTMSHQVSVWRAAQLVGVARGVLQQQVRNGALVLSDGLVSTEPCCSCIPDARLEESGLLERVAQIRDEAFGKRVRERMLPSQEVLAQRLFAQSQELADLRRHLQRYHGLVVDAAAAVFADCLRSTGGDAAAWQDTGAAGHTGPGAGAGDRVGRFAGGDGRHAQSHDGTGHGAPQRARVLGGGARQLAAVGTAGRTQAQLRLRQRQLRHVQGARDCR